MGFTLRIKRGDIPVVSFLLEHLIRQDYIMND